MSRRVTNLIESILGSAASAQSVADTAKSTYAPKMPTGTAQAAPGRAKEKSVLEKSAESVITQALAKSKAKKK